MEQRKVQEPGGEGTSPVETPSPAGTTAPTRAELEQLRRDLEAAKSHFQSVADRRVAEAERKVADLERRMGEQSPREEDYDDDLLSAQAGYFQQQQPSLVFDPVSNQWVQDPYAPQKAEVERRRQARARRELQQYRQELAEIRNRQNAELWIDQTLAAAGMSRAEINPYEYSPQEFAAEVARRKAERDEAGRAKRDEDWRKAKEEEIRQQLLQQSQQAIQSGAIDQFTGGPPAPTPSGDKAERLSALNDAFNAGKLDGETFRKRVEEIMRE